MHESPEDLTRLQALLDDTYRAGGAHLREIHTDQVRIDAADVAARLVGMQVLVVATVTADGRPLTGPVDGFLYRGHLCFGTGEGALRTRHLTRAPWISATHVRGEDLVVTAHGRARRLDLAGDDAEFAELCREQYGADWDSWGPGSPYFAIEAERMLAADMSRHRTG